MTITLEAFGLTLRRLTEADIETVRQKRNSAEIQRFMAWRGHITQEMQREWFRSIDNPRNYYFLLYADGQEPVGLFNLKDIDRRTATAEKGSMIWDTAMRGHLIGTRATMVMLDFAFECLNLRRLIAHVLPENARSLAMYRKFGFRTPTPTADEATVCCTLSRQRYAAHRPEIVAQIEQGGITPPR